MGNFASSAEWIHTPTHTSVSLVRRVPHVPSSYQDLFTHFAVSTVAMCTQTLEGILKGAVNALHTREVQPATDQDNDQEWMDDVFDEFHIVFEPSYKPSPPLTTTTPWFIRPDDCDVVKATMLHNKSKTCPDDDNRSSTTEATEDLSDAESDDMETVDVSFQDDDFDSDFGDHVQLPTALQFDQLESHGPVKTVHVRSYLCECGDCPHFDQIVHDVQRVMTWRDTETQHSVTRLLRAYATYDETRRYHRDMITTTDACLRLWGGDEDRAFSTFIQLQDELETEGMWSMV